MVVVIVVDGQQVAVHIGIAHQELHVRDAVDVLQEAVELIEAARLRPIQREPTELCTKLSWQGNKKKKKYRYKCNCVNKYGSKRG